MTVPVAARPAKKDPSRTGPGRPHSGQDPARTLVGAFADSVAAHGAATALVADGASFTYRKLDSWSCAVAALLRSHGVRRGDRVALRMAPGAAALVSMLGILRTGAAYVPLDVRNPPSRNTLILRDSRVAALIGSPEGCAADGLPVIGEDTVTELRDTAPQADPAPDRAPDPAQAPGPDDCAYVIYTSGTTGRPKGVPIHHGAVTALLAGAAQRLDLHADDRWLLFHSIAFDVSVWEIWGALSTGARLVVLPYWQTRSPEHCLAVIEAERISVLGQTPTAFSTLSAAALDSEADLSALRYVVFAGEKLAPDTLRPWAARHGTARPALINMYGITETTVHSTFHRLTADDIAGDDSVIGHPLPGFAHRVITAQGTEAGPGEQGVLWLAGPQLSKGYLHRPELNETRFRTLPPPGDGPGRRYYRSGDLVSRRTDGTLIYHGREDLQVKLRGHRIEIGDIESAVRSHERIADAVVWVRPFGDGDERLVCAYASAPGAPDTPARDLRDHLKSLLPSYMRPAAYRRLPQLPRTVNGKLDRDAISRLWEEERDRQS